MLRKCNTLPFGKIKVDKHASRPHNIHILLNKEGKQMKALTAYVEQQNRWNAIFGKAPMNINGLTQKEVDDIAHSIDAGLSPENLHCDGEISAAEANRKYRNYMKIIADLETYCKRYGYNMPYMYEA